ncbi:MAG: lipopolysaccharide assembly protein LapB [Thioalkalispiraceae bacterium]|jgi:lipopolysaccharide biosynthesis regulator YciM
MLIEVLFLLLPLAALSGWWVARKSYRKSSDNCNRDFSTNYITGLNYLLNEQPDKAIDLFIQMLEVDNDTVETHLALGSLFRKRGEVDRSIRIHQNLIARPTLTARQRSHALYELAHDYMSAGLLDRSEALFSDLAENDIHRASALRQLIDIYQQEKEWNKAIIVAQKLAVKTNQDLNPLIAQYYCELAEQAYRDGEPAKALRLVKRALATDRNCPRASILEGDIEKDNGQYKAAIKAYKRIEQQDAEYLPEIISSLLDCYRAVGKLDELIFYLKEVLAKHDSITIMLVLSDLIKQQKGDNAAAEFISDFLHHRPSVRGMDRLIDLNIKQASESSKEKLQILKDVTVQILKDNPVYQCTSCGFNAKSLHWQCPGCKQWSTIKPIHGVEGE